MGPGICFALPAVSLSRLSGLLWCIAMGQAYILLWGVGVVVGLVGGIKSWHGMDAKRIYGGVSSARFCQIGLFDVSLFHFLFKHTISLYVTVLRR
jgi:hypothetical protein